MTVTTSRPAFATDAAPRRPRSVSVIVTTYNWPEALDQVLHGLSRQTRLPDEVVIADDGSKEPTRALIAEWTARAPFPVIHTWQDDKGFRAARARNLAAARAKGEYIVTLDGDGLVLPRFLATHLAHAEPAWFTVGRRCYMRKWASDAIVKHGLRPHAWPKGALFPISLLGGSNRPLQLLNIPQTPTRRKNRPTEWNKAQTCNLGVWRDEWMRIGGFEEGFETNCLEDTDFVVRLIRAGVRRITLEHAEPVLHIWHPRKSIREDNRAALNEVMNSSAILPRRSLLRDAALR